MVIWIALMAFSALVGRTSIANDHGNASADFLNIGVSARAAGIGGAYSAVAGDVSALYYNPAGLAWSEGVQLSFSHFAWLQDINYDFFGVTYQINEKVTFGGSAQYLGYGKIEGYDSNDNPTGEVGSTFDAAGTISMGYKVTDGISFGVSGKYVMVSLAGIQGTALAADFGFRYVGRNYMVGLSANNWGNKIEFEDAQNNLPASIRGGLAFNPFGSEIMTAFEIEKQVYGGTSFKSGLEYNFGERYFARSGYALSNDNSQGLSLGVGAIIGPSQIDYTYSPVSNGLNDNLHRFTISFKLDK
jgi:hypothetical protein